MPHRNDDTPDGVGQDSALSDLGADVIKVEPPGGDPSLS